MGRFGGLDKLALGGENIRKVESLGFILGQLPRMYFTAIFMYFSLLFHRP